jgi:uncharacterized coiled-coil protein SlyX
MLPVNPGMNLTGRSLTGTTLEQRVADLEARLAKLEKVLPLAADGSLTIAAPKITLNSLVVEVKAANSLTLGSGNWMLLKSGLSIDLKSGSDIYLQGSNATMKTNSFSIQASGGASVSGDSMLVFNKGTRPLARVGDAISPNGAPAGMAGVIAPNTSTVLG